LVLLEQLLWISEAGITLQEGTVDQLLCGDSSGSLTVKNCYKAILSTQQLPLRSGWKASFWKWRIQLKILLFFWLATEFKILTWDTLQRKGWVGPGMCPLCRAATEDNAHLFINCSFTQAAWAKVLSTLKLNVSWSGQNLTDCMESWTSIKAAPKKLPVLMCWYLWLERNKALFEGKLPTVTSVVHQTLSLLTKLPTAVNLQAIRQSPIFRLTGYTMAFFDGASSADGSICGAGGSLKRTIGPDIRWFFNCGTGSNTKAELVGAWATFAMEKLLNIHHIQIFGDSKVVIEWLKQKYNLQAVNIEGWKRRTRDLATSFQRINYQHIYRESNEEADKLSKRALSAPKGRLNYFNWDGEVESSHQFIKIF
jgi:ribonuclease HI